MKSRLWIIILLTIIFGTAVAFAQEKVAVIVSSGGAASTLSDSVNSLEQKAVSTYSALGFKVIVLGGSGGKAIPLSPEALVKSLSDLRNVKDLRLDFIGHGILASLPADKFQGKGLTMSKQHRADSFVDLGTEPSNKVVWFADNSSNLDQEGRWDFAYAYILGMTHGALQPISHEAVANGLKSFRDNNGGGIATINLLNCFSGSLAQLFRSTPNTIVFSNSPANQPAMDMSLWAPNGIIRPENGLSYYYDVLSKEGESSFSEARAFSSGQMRATLQSSPERIYYIGRSPVFESVMGWCEEGRPNASEKSAALNADQAEIKRDLEGEMSSQVRSFDFAYNSPSYYNPHEKAVNAYKEEYDACVKPGYQIPIPQSAPVKSTGETLREAYRDKPMAPLQIIFRKYVEILSDPKYQNKITAKVRASVEERIQESRKSGIKEDKLGTLKIVSDQIKTGALTDEAIIKRLQIAVKQILHDCQGTPDEPQCKKHSGKYQILSEWIEKPWAEQGKDVKNCLRDKNFFECRFSGNGYGLNQSPWREVEEYWGGDRKTPTVDICHNLNWPVVQKIKADIDADGVCLQDFIAHAPREEWSNLSRIKVLSNRDIKSGLKFQRQQRDGVNEVKRVSSSNAKSEDERNPASIERKRSSAWGYFAKSLDRRILFLRHPGILEENLEVKFRFREAQNRACVLTKLTSPLQCPRQNLTFTLVKSKTKIVAADATFDSPDRSNAFVISEILGN